MGMCLDSTPDMGEYSVEVRRESFYLRGQDSYEQMRRHGINVYDSGHGQGTVEILIEDIPKIRAALDRIEGYLKHKAD